MDAAVTPTEQAHHQLAEAFRRLNDELFAGKLPPCLITLQRNRATRGYFSPYRFIRGDLTTAHEIGINPQFFALATIPEVLSELCHNMVHLWAHVNGVQGRRGYHSVGWADQMEAVGLTPSTTGRPGGHRTGERVSHFITPGGRFEQVADSMVAEGFEITWLDRVAEPWVEGDPDDAVAPKREERLIGRPLLGRMGLLVPHGDGDEMTPPEAGGARSVAEQSVTLSSHDKDDTSLDPVDALWPSTDDHENGPAPFASHHDEDGHVRDDKPVTLEAGTKPRPGDVAREVPLLVMGDAAQDSGQKKRQDKVRFVCPSCGLKAWAKGSALLECGQCHVPMPAKAGHASAVEPAAAGEH